MYRPHVSIRVVQIYYNVSLEIRSTVMNTKMKGHICIYGLAFLFAWRVVCEVQKILSVTSFYFVSSIDSVFD